MDLSDWRYALLIEMLYSCKFKRKFILYVCLVNCREATEELILAGGFCSRRGHLRITPARPLCMHDSEHVGACCFTVCVYFILNILTFCGFI